MNYSDFDQNEILSKLQRWKAAYDGILNEHRFDQKHEEKRIESFFIFDLMLEWCCCGECPYKIFNGLTNYILTTLTDISIDGYINQRAYFFGIDGIGRNDLDRYFMAINKVDFVFHCTRHFHLDRNVFELDSKQIFEGTSDSHIFTGARKRKAFWRFMDLNPRNEPITDFCQASRFIEETHRISGQLECTKNDLEQMKSLIQNNRNIANAIDLFRFCYVRDKVESGNDGIVNNS